MPRALIARALSGRMGLFLVGLLMFGVYLGLGWFLMKPQIIWAPDEGAKWLQMYHLRWEDGLKVDIRYQGLALDSNFSFAPSDAPRGLLGLQNGRLFFRRLPLFPAISKIFYMWIGHRGLIILPALGGALMGVATLQLAGPQDRRIAMWLLVAIASPVLIYALLFWEHTLASGLALVAAWLVVRGARDPAPSPRSVIQKWLGAGLLLAISIALRLEVAIFAGALLAACWLLIPNQRRGIYLTGIVLVIGLMVQAVVNNNLFGQAIPDDAVYQFHPFKYLSQAGWGVVRDLLIGPHSDEAIDPGATGTLWALTAVAALIFGLFRHGSSLVRYLWLLIMGLYILLAASFLFTGTPYRSAHGLLFSTPWVLLGYCRVRELWVTEKQTVRIVVLTTVLGSIGYVVSVVFLRAASPHGGLEWGNRFFLTFMPLLAIMAAWKAPGSLRQSGYTHLLIALLMLLGLGFQIRGIRSIYNDKILGEALVQELNEARETGYHLSSELWWLPYSANSIYAEEAIYIYQDANDSLWLQLVNSEAIARLAIVTLNKNWLEHVLSIQSDFPFRLDQARRLDNIWVLYLSKPTPPGPSSAQ